MNYFLDREDAEIATGEACDVEAEDDGADVIKYKFSIRAHIGESPERLKEIAENHCQATGLSPREALESLIVGLNRQPAFVSRNITPFFGSGNQGAAERDPETFYVVGYWPDGREIQRTKSGRWRMV